MSVKVLKFSATWCGPCRVLSHTLEGVEGITNIDIDQDMETARKYNIRSVPALVFLKDDKEVGRSLGAISLDRYNQILNEVNN
jgi:thioredoxin 1